MRYFGSKVSTLGALEGIINLHAQGGVACDPFGGIGTVSGMLRSRGFRVHAGDQLRFAHLFQCARLCCSGTPDFVAVRTQQGYGSVQALCDDLRTLSSSQSWFSEEYAGERAFFSRSNADKIAAVWQRVLDWKAEGLLSHLEEAYLLASLIDSMDKVANTAGTYYAHLKQLSEKAARDFRFQLMQPCNGPVGCSRLADAVDLVGMRAWDLVYLDPPYNGRAYSGYYHLPETIALGATDSIVTGLSGVPCRQKPRSAFNSRATAARELELLVGATETRVLIFHYSDDGLITPAEVHEILSNRGRVTSESINALGYSTKGGRSQVSHRVYVVNCT